MACAPPQSNRVVRGPEDVHLEVLFYEYKKGKSMGKDRSKKKDRQRQQRDAIPNRIVFDDTIRLWGVIKWEKVDDGGGGG